MSESNRFDYIHAYFKQYYPKLVDFSSKPNRMKGNHFDQVIVPCSTIDLCDIDFIIGNAIQITTSTEKNLVSVAYFVEPSEVDGYNSITIAYTGSLFWWRVTHSIPLNSLTRSY